MYIQTVRCKELLLSTCSQCKRFTQKNQQVQPRLGYQVKGRFREEAKKMNSTEIWPDQAIGQWRMLSRKDVHSSRHLFHPGIFFCNPGRNEDAFDVCESKVKRESNEDPPIHRIMAIVPDWRGLNSICRKFILPSSTEATSTCLRKVCIDCGVFTALTLLTLLIQFRTKRDAQCWINKLDKDRLKKIDLNPNWERSDLRLFWSKQRPSAPEGAVLQDS